MTDGDLNRDGAFDALIIADGAGEADQAVAAAGGRTLRRIGWASVSDDLGPQMRRPILLIEAQGVSEATLSGALPHLARVVDLLELNAIVSLDETQIDSVAAAMMGGRVQLLCMPTVAERIVALTVATELGGRTALHDRVNEGEAARLTRLNEEVARIADVLARLSQRDEPDAGRGGVGDRGPTFDAGPSVDAEPIDPAMIRQLIRARRLRDRQFGRGLFEDPAWDMMLDLFAANLERAQVSVSSLCIASAVAPTTALRWIARMTETGLFERHPDPFDRRRAYMALSPRAVEGMRAYVAMARAQGLPIA